MGDEAIQARTAVEAFAAELRLVRIAVRARTAGGLKVPPFKGSVLRSVFIDRLRARQCRRLDRATCTGCPDAGACPFPPLGQPDAWPASLPRGIAGPTPGLFLQPPVDPRRDLPDDEAFDFCVALAGVRVTHLPQVVEVIRTLETDGLGQDRGRLRVESVEVAGATRTAPLTDPHAPPLEAMDRRDLSGRRRVQVELRTPLSFKEANREVRPADFDAPTFLRAVHRRLRQLAACHQPGLPELPRTDALGPVPALAAADLRTQRHQRYSSRQQQWMSVEGLLGRFTLEGDLDTWGPLLALGELAQVGRHAAFGLGCYRLSVE
jgi:hypothetical protein